MKYFVEAGAIAVRRVKPEDIKRIAKATGGQLVSTMVDVEGMYVYEYVGIYFYILKFRMIPYLCIRTYL